MGYKVVAPYVLLKVRNNLSGSYQMVEFYSGAPVPEGIEPANLQHHLDSGQVVDEGDPVAEVFAVPAGTPLPGRPPNVEVTESTRVGQPVPPLDDELLKAAEIQPDSTSASVSRSVKAFEQRPTGRQAQPSDELVQEQEQREQQSDGKPRLNAPKEEWLEYRVNERVQQRPEGQPEEDARQQARAEFEGKSKAELVAGR